MLDFNFTSADLIITERPKHWIYTCKTKNGRVLFTRTLVKDRKYIAVLIIGHRDRPGKHRVFFFYRHELIGKGDSASALAGMAGDATAWLCLEPSTQEIHVTPSSSVSELDCQYCNEQHSARVICDEQIRSLGTF